MSRPISTASANRLLGGLSITALAMMLVPAASAQVAPSVAPEGQVAPADAPPPLAAPPMRSINTCAKAPNYLKI